MFATAAALTPESMKEIATAIYGEMKDAGYGAVGEFHYVHHDQRGVPYDDPNEMAKALVEAAAGVGLRIVMLPAAYHRNGWDGQDRPAEGGQLRFCDRDLGQFLGRVDDLRSWAEARAGVDVGVAAHSIRAVPRSWLEGISEYAERHGLVRHVHASEQRRELEECQAEHGCSPIELLADSGFLGPRTSVIHGTHVSESDVALLAGSRSIVVACPTTEANLGDGYLPAARYRDAGVRLAIGSDSQTRIDPFEEIREIESIARRGEETRIGLLTDDADLWGTVARAGRESLGIEGDDSTVEVDLTRPSIEGVPDRDLPRALIACGTAAIVSPPTSLGTLTPAGLEEVARGGAPTALADEDLARIERARSPISEVLDSSSPTYGVNTGFGRLENVHIDTQDTAQLQVNLLRSHAVGTGDPLPEEVVRGMLQLLAASLARGNSGVRPQVVSLILSLLERGVTPVVPSKGSVGSSGDLAPLAHMGLVLIGEGEATFEGSRSSGAGALAAAGLEPIGLTAKEGLALINGTHLMASVGTLAVRDATRLVDAATVATALSLEAFKGSTVPFDARIHELRNQPGQIEVASRLRGLLAESEIVRSHADCGRVQDPYTLRCAPQVIGAVADAVGYAAGALERELSAVTDNPLVFPDTGEILSGGNFHGQPLSLPLDHLALAMCELTSFSERRSFALLSPGYSDLPAFLTPNPGLSSGLMITQYVAASLVNECQVLSHPAGAGSIPTSAGQEDFNSMGAFAGLKARSVVENVSKVIAIELVCAVQGIEFHRPLRSSEPLEEAIRKVRELVPRLEEDRSLAGEIDTLASAIRTGALTFDQ